MAKKKAPVYLVFGGDEYSVQEKAREIVAALVPPEQEAFGLELVEAQSDTVDRAVSELRSCIEAVTTVGFLGTGKVVWLRNAGFFGDGVVARSERVKEQLGELASLIKAGLPEGHTLVITAGSVDKRLSFYKACKAQAEIIEFKVAEKAYKTENEARERIRTEVAQRGLKMGRDVSDAFLQRAGVETRQIVNELDKLQLYMGDRDNVTMRDVDLMVSVSREAAGWDLADAVGQRDLPQAIRVLRRLVFQKVSPIAMIMGLHRRLQEMAVFRSAFDEGWLSLKGSGDWQQAEWNLPPEISEQFTVLERANPETYNPYRAGRIAQQARRFSPREIERCRALAVQAHERMVSAAVPQPLLLELLLLRMIGRQRTRSAR